MVEILAPVGNIASLKTAIACNADAVYFGLDCFNARIKADNFTLENVKEYVELCHVFGVKVYITFNTCIKQKEIAQFESYVDYCAKIGVDAFIVTDLGMLSVFWKYNIPLHASTQLGVCNVEGAKLIESFGFCRVILARETLESDIIKIKQQTKLEIEYFVHGALCVGYSGNCLISSMMSGDSGNRGCCNQPCRLPYTTSQNMISSKYLLSTSELCLISKIDRLAAIGVDSFKIEGRLKQPHYVGEVVSQYKYALENHKMRDNSLQMLKRAYNRGDFTLGYNYELTPQIMSTNIQGQLGEKVGKILGYKNQRLTILTNCDVAKGSGVKIINDNKELGGFSLDDGFEQKGRQIIIKSQKNYPADSSVHLTLDKNQVENFADCEPKITVDISFVAKVGKAMKITMSICDKKLQTINNNKTKESISTYKNFGGESEKLCIEVFGEVVQVAQNAPTTIEQISKQLSKLNDTNFVENNIDIDCDDNCFIAVSVANALRREATEMLKKMCLANYEKTKQVCDYSKQLNEYLSASNVRDSGCNKTLTLSNQSENNISNSSENCSNRPFVITSDFSNISDKVAQSCNIILEIRDFGQQNVQSILKSKLIENNIAQNLYFYFPRIVRGKDSLIVKSVFDNFLPYLKGAICDNLYAVQLSKSVVGTPGGKQEFITIGGMGLNIYNNRYANVVGLDNFIPSVELNMAELNELKKYNIVFGFGRLVVMNLSHCPVQLNTKCTCNSCKYNGDFCYRDKKEEYVLSQKILANCYFDMYNPQVVDIRSKLEKFDCQFVINSYGFDKKQVDKIVADFLCKKGESLQGSTNGHYFRGVK